MDPARLKTLPLFASMDEQNLRQMATFATQDSAGEGSTLIREGDYSTEIYVIEEGTADVMHEGRRLGTLGPGDVFGEIGVVDNQMRTASVVATSPMRLIRLTTWEVKRMGPDVLARLRELVEERRMKDRIKPEDAGASQ
jgi:CRP/FNR family transcriptional regulator, cyclic AMP receptor protein